MTFLLKSKIILLLLLLSCEKKNYTQGECEEISMGAFKGNPFDAKKLQSNCQKYELKFNKQYCQSALKELMMGVPLTEIQNKYDPKITGCFSKNDLKKFSSSYKK